METAIVALAIVIVGGLALIYIDRRFFREITVLQIHVENGGRVRSLEKILMGGGQLRGAIRVSFQHSLKLDPGVAVCRATAEGSRLIHVYEWKGPNRIVWDNPYLIKWLRKNGWDDLGTV